MYMYTHRMVVWGTMIISAPTQQFNHSFHIMMSASHCMCIPIILVLIIPHLIITGLSNLQSSESILYRRRQV